MIKFNGIQSEVEEAIASMDFKGKPIELYEPVNYMLTLGGKRIRPVLCLMSCEMFGKPRKYAMNPALGMELFHNFTLMHDDIMDAASLRRGKQTVHKKWNDNNAILSGDLLQILANKYILWVDDDILREVLDLYNDTAIKVCEGQQLDMQFESRDDVIISEYMEMIELKTATLLAACLELGGLIAGANPHDRNMIYEFGKHLGIAFQLQDDILDSFGDRKTFGKKIGGDILAHKKTYLLLKAQERADAKEQKLLIETMADEKMDPDTKIGKIQKLFGLLGVKRHAIMERERHFDKAVTYLMKVKVPDERKKPLLDLATGVMNRKT